MFSVNPMAVFGISAATKASRLAAVATLLFLFFLPLHFHFSLGSQVSNQCSCLYGGRSPLAPPVTSSVIVPTPQLAVLLEPQVRHWHSPTPQRQAARGPPRFHSV